MNRRSKTAMFIQHGSLRAQLLGIKKNEQGRKKSKTKNRLIPKPSPNYIKFKKIVTLHLTLAHLPKSESIDFINRQMAVPWTKLKKINKDDLDFALRCIFESSQLENINHTLMVLSSFNLVAKIFVVDRANAILINGSAIEKAKNDFLDRLICWNENDKYQIFVHQKYRTGRVICCGLSFEFYDVTFTEQIENYAKSTQNKKLSEQAFSLYSVSKFLFNFSRNLYQSFK